MPTDTNHMSPAAAPPPTTSAEENALPGTTFRQAAEVCMTTKYATFEGRAARSEYWWFSVVYVAAAAVAAVAGLFFDSLLPSLLILPFITPMLAAAIRRLHDTGRSAWSMLIALIPLAGPIAYLYLQTIDSQPGDNQYGPSPKVGASQST